MDIIIGENLGVSVLLNAGNQGLVNMKMVVSDMGTTNMGGEFSEIPMDPLGAGGKDPLLSSWPFVIGISAASLALSVFIGILLAKRKIKKGFELYED